MSREIQAIAVDRRDNVATAIKTLKSGDCVQTEYEEILLIQDIQFGHKFALQDIPKGDYVIKYGSPIGRTTAPICRGEHVHVHNVEDIVDEVRKRG